MTEKLKACPFCGGEPVTSTYYLECNGKNCIVEPKLEWSWFKSRDEAIAAWNNRTAEPEEAPLASPTETAGMDEKRKALLKRLETGAMCDSDAMQTLDAVKLAAIEHPEGSLARDIYEGFIDDIHDDVLALQQPDKTVETLKGSRDLIQDIRDWKHPPATMIRLIDEQLSALNALLEGE